MFLAARMREFYELPSPQDRPGKTSCDCATRAPCAERAPLGLAPSPSPAFPFAGRRLSVYVGKPGADLCPPTGVSCNPEVVYGRTCRLSDPQGIRGGLLRGIFREQECDPHRLPKKALGRASGVRGLSPGAGRAPPAPGPRLRAGPWESLVSTDSARARPPRGTPGMRAARVFPRG